MFDANFFLLPHQNFYQLFFAPLLGYQAVIIYLSVKHIGSLLEVYVGRILFIITLILVLFHIFFTFCHCQIVRCNSILLFVSATGRVVPDPTPCMITHRRGGNYKVSICQE